MELEEIELSIKKNRRYAVALIIFTPLAYATWFYLINDYSLAVDSSTWGTFGDFIGGVLNPIIALLAFYWLTQSVLIQKTELFETREALVDASNSQRQQAITQEKKRFEDTFFSLLEQHNKVIDQINETILIHGKPAISSFDKMKENIFKNNNIKNIEQARDHLHKHHNPTCGHYFRLLYQLLKLIAVNCHGSSISNKFTTEEIKSAPITTDEKFYSNIVRSFISFDMAKLLAVNCVCDRLDESYYRYRLLLERYNFLEHMPLDNELIIQAIDKYEEKVFGESAFYTQYKQQTNTLPKKSG